MYIGKVPRMSAIEFLIAKSPQEEMEAGAILMQRAEQDANMWFVESGRVALGVLAPDEIPGRLEHQIGEVEGPGWLDLAAVVLEQGSVTDAVAETEVILRRVSVSAFKNALSQVSEEVNSLLTGMARAHRQQLEVALSRLAKDAEARCAEWLLRHAQETDKGGCSVQLQQRKRLIAAQLGIAPETLSRVLRHLREQRLISGSGRKLDLVDLSGLRLLAGV